MSDAKDAYQKAINEANPFIKKINDNKKSMDEIKAKYEKEFDSTDTKKWSEEAAKEYNEAIKTYNASVKEAATSMAAVEAAKNTYTEARTAFETAENNYYEQIRNDHAQQNTDDSTHNIDDGSNGGNNNEGNDNNNGDNNGDNNQKTDESKTDLHTDNIVFNESGDIVFDMNNNGQVQGATLDTGQVNLDAPAGTDTPTGNEDKTSLDTSDLSSLIS
jgi:hypothetical protein